MYRFLRRVRRDERGMSFVVLGMGFMALLGASTLAIDVGMFMTARNQAQNAADAGALAGAVALAFDSYTDRSANGPAVQNALQAARPNSVIGQQVAITPADVTFSNDPQGLPNRVSVHVYRTADRGNAVSTLMGNLFGLRAVDVDALATGEIAPANAASCLMPFTLPDKWIDRTGPQNCFEAYYQGGNRREDADIYRPPSSNEAGTGYTIAADTGTQLRLRPGRDGRVAQPFFYYTVRLPGSLPADFGRNIATCNGSTLQVGDLMTAEPGDLVEATRRGVEDRIAQDPNAYWDTFRGRVASQMSPSPRVVAIPLFNPDHYDLGRNNGRNADLKVGNFVGFFLESVNGDDVVGRITPISGLVRGSQPPIGGFPRAIRLVQ